MTDLKPSPSPRLIYLMVFVSGFAGLVYQVLWMKQLGFLFGSTAHAAGATLSAFFAGLAAGSWYWGRGAETTKNPLRVYAWLEAGIALTALLYFLVLGLFTLLYPLVYQSVASAPLLLIIKFALALLLIFPPAFCMGGTIPIVGQALINQPKAFGATAALLYGINTLGAALGAFLTGFYLVLLLGFSVTCVAAMILTGAVSAAAFCLSRQAGEPVEPDQSKTKKARKGKKEEPVLGRQKIHALCFLSGFGVLALEVLWTRMFAQVHENSVYSFASVLVIVLISLALGALVASGLARTRLGPVPVLAGLMVASGLAITASPFIFMHLTNNLEMMATTGSFSKYVLTVFINGFACAGGVALLLGTIFPYLMKTEERFEFHPGQSLGRLAAVNTVGAILGSLLCGFLLLRLFGMWRTMQLIAALYLMAGIILPSIRSVAGVMIRVAGVGGLVLLFTVLNPSGLAVTGKNPKRPPEKVLKTWEASDCTVAVVENVYGSRAIKVNSNYSLGSSGAVPHQVFQSKIPLLAFPQTKSIFFLGLGTGITAGAVLVDEFKDVERIVACELVAEVVTAAKEYIVNFHGRDLTNGLFDDPRATILIEDGRHYLMATDNTFDMINADLFLPYRSGAGSLYSRDHYLCAKERLNPGGVFVQWLPLYQITELEFGTITRTMLSVFDQVTLWRNNFQPGGEMVALVGHHDQKPLAACELEVGELKRAAVAGKNSRSLRDMLLPFDQQTALLFYCGNVSVTSKLFDQYPINTDDRPLIEYTAPKTLRQSTDDRPPTFVGPPLAKLVEKMLKLCPPADDPILINRTDENRRLPLAGAALHRAWIGNALGDSAKRQDGWNRFVREWTNENNN